MEKNAPALEMTTAVTVAVPPFIDLSTGAFAAGTVDVQVVQKKGGVTRRSIAVPGFQIQTLPFPAAPAGTTTLDFLTGAADLARQLQNDIPGTPLDNTDLKNAIAAQIANLDTVIAEVQAVVQDPSRTFLLGTIDGDPIIIGASDLLAVDRTIMGMLLAQAGSTSASGNAFELRSFAQQTGGGCQAQEARSLADAIGTEQRPNVALYTGYYGAPRTSINCKTAEAFNTTYLIVGGAGAVGVGILALGGLPAIALALPAAALLYVTVAGGGGMIAVGGALGQDTPGAIELVQGGVQKIESQLRSILVGTVLPKTAGTLVGLFQGASSLIEAFTTAPISPPPPPPPPPPPDTLTWNFNASVSVDGFPAGCAVAFVLPFAGGSASFPCDIATATATVDIPGLFFSVSGFGNASFDGVVCTGTGGGSSAITETATSFSTNGPISGGGTCNDPDFGPFPFMVSGSYSASAAK